MMNLLVLSMGAGVMERVNDVVCMSEPEVPVTVMAYDPAVVEREGERVRMLVQLGVQDTGENEAEVLVGRPETENDTETDAPDVRDVVMVLDTLNPCTTDTDVRLGEREKSNEGEGRGIGGGGEGVTEASVVADTVAD